MMNNKELKELVQGLDMEDIPTRNLVAMAMRQMDVVEDPKTKALLFLTAARLEWYEKRYKEEISRRTELV